MLTTYAGLAHRQLTMHFPVDGDVVLASIEDAAVSTSHDKTVAVLAGT